MVTTKRPNACVLIDNWLGGIIRYCSSSATKANTSTPSYCGPKYKCSVKVIDPSKLKLDYDVAELNSQEKLESVDEIKQAILESAGSQVGDVGYILPGYGMRGKKCELENGEDLYASCSGECTCTICLWCTLATTSVSSKTQKSKKRKHSQDEDDPGPQSKRAVKRKYRKLRILLPS